MTAFVEGLPPVTRRYVRPVVAVLGGVIAFGVAVSALLISALMGIDTTETP